MSDQADSPSPPSPSPANPITLELPGELDAAYSNFAVITHSPSELVIDFARVMPNIPKAKVVARVVMTPMNAKLLLRALSENLSRYEGQYGEIVLPEGASLADHLFRGPRAPE